MKNVSYFIVWFLLKDYGSKIQQQANDQVWYIATG